MAEQSAINLIRGWPSTSLLPTTSISKAAQAALADTSIAYPGLLYGPDEGYGPLREELAKWLTEFYQPSTAIQKERLTITGGASQNLGCMLQVFTDPVHTRSVQMVAPAYMLAFRIFQDNGLADKLRAVPEDEKGVDIKILRRQLQQAEEAGVGSSATMLKPRRSYSKYYRHVIYCVPTFSNPSSRTMSLDHDVYDLLQWPADPSIPTKEALEHASFPRLVDIDRTLDGGAERQGADGFGNAVSNGSFSKICGPGIRVGWAEGSPKFAYGVSQTGTTASGGAPSQLTSTYMTKLLQTGTLQKHILEVLQPAYAARCRTLVQAVETELVPLGVTLPQSGREVVGGYFIWLMLPETVLADEFAQRCGEEANVIVAPGSIFQVPGDDSVQFKHSLRLTFSWVDTEDMVEAVRRMRPVLESSLRGEGPRNGAASKAEIGSVK
ncbi:hypothetical protein MBLNU459_g4574t1 [Dothideomycetes sp. NU459]